MEYLKFIKWDKEHAIFERANVMELLLYYSGISALFHVLGIHEGDFIIIKMPKRIEMQWKATKNKDKRIKKLFMQIEKIKGEE